MKARWPGFRILDRYILGKFLSTFFFAIAMIIVIVVIFDYVEKVDNFTESHAPFKGIVFTYYLNFIPYFINQFSGLFTFIACIFFTSKMAYQTEIVAMLSGGMSFRRLMWPYFLGRADHRFALARAEPLAHPDLAAQGRGFQPGVHRQGERVLRTPHLPADRTRHVRLHPRLQRHDAAGVVLRAGALRRRFDDPFARSRRHTVQPRDQTLDGPALHQARVRLAGHGDLRTVPQPRHAHQPRGDRTGRDQRPDPDHEHLPAQRIPRPAARQGLRLDQHHRGRAPLALRLPLLDLHPDAHRRLALSRKVRGGTGLHIGIGTGLCFSYILFNRFFEEFAKSGSLPPGLAVWLPNIIYLCIAIYLYRKAPK